jgi:Kdo2-lipid IVA lauroyltransferase/acyltransferase
MKSLLRALSHCPLGFVQGLGAFLGLLVWVLSPTYRRRLSENLTQAGYPRGHRLRAAAHAGRMSLEAPWLWFRSPDRPLGHLFQWDGAEEMEKALAAGKGLVLLTPHLGGFEFAARSYAERYGDKVPVTVLYRPSRQPWLAELQTDSRNAPGMEAAPANLAGVRQMLRALRKGQTLGLLPDQVPPDGQGVWVSFFDRPAYTMTLAARLVQQTGCAVMLTWTERRSFGRGFVNRYRHLPVPMPAEGEEAATAVVNQSVEWMIRQCPDQYLWGYNRYKKPRQA